MAKKVSTVNDKTLQNDEIQYSCVTATVGCCVWILFVILSLFSYFENNETEEWKYLNGYLKISE